MGDNVTPIGKGRRLSDIVREVKMAAAERDDVVVDMKEADLARLEILAEDLRPVFEDVPADDDQFDFAVSSGLQPRLWIDATAHVHMGRDRRSYRFVRDTRLGRVVLVESPDREKVADRVSRYIAERIIERQRMMEGERESLFPREAPVVARREPVRRAVEEVSEQPARQRETAERPRMPERQPAPEPPARARRAPERAPTPGQEVVAGVLWFLIGTVAGAALLLTVLWDNLIFGG